MLLQPQPPGDGKGVGLARYADEQPVGGPQRLHVELTAGVLHPRRGHGEGLQLRVVGGGGGERPLAPHVLDDGDGQRRALHRVSARAQLVKEDQTPVVRLLQYLHRIGHVGREGGQALLDALLIAHIRQNAVEHLHGALVSGGDVQPALGHQTQKPDGFQRHRLAAGVGPGDDQRVEGRPQRHGDGHSLGRVQQRMPRPAQVDAALFPHLRPPRVHGVAQLRPGEDGIQLHQQVVVVQDVLPLGGALAGQNAEDAVDLLLLPGLQFLQFVVGLHHAHRLDEQRRAGGGDVMHQSRQTALALRLHRHDEPPVPLGDQRLLQYLGVGRGGDDALQYLPPLGGSHPHTPPYVRQLRAGGVGDGLLVQNGGAYPVL